MPRTKSNDPKNFLVGFKMRPANVTTLDDVVNACGFASRSDAVRFAVELMIYLVKSGRLKPELAQLFAEAISLDNLFGRDKA